jgi:hypothetical protein
MKLEIFVGVPIHLQNVWPKMTRPQKVQPGKVWQGKYKIFKRFGILIFLPDVL